MPFTFNGTNIVNVVFNGTTVTTVVFNGTTVFSSYNYSWVFYGTSNFQSPDIVESGYFCGNVSAMQSLLNSYYPPNSYPGYFAQVYDFCYNIYYNFYSV
jgi:hypothetical protein